MQFTLGDIISGKKLAQIGRGLRDNTDEPLDNNATAQRRDADRKSVHDATEAAGKPDVLFIAVDDLNDWVGAMGGPIQAKTPNIDALAERGMFLPTHIQWNLLHAISHRSAHRYEPVQQWSLFPRNWRESDVFSSAPTLPRYFRDNGYQTLGAGKIFHAPRTI